MRSSILPGVDDSTLRVAVRVTKRGDEAFAWADILKQGGDSSGEFQARAINEIVVAVHRQLIAPEEQRLAAAQTSLPNVMELLEYGSRLRSLRKNEAAIEVLRQVIAADPNLARAYSELARALINYGWYTPVESAMAMPDARLAAWRALELDPSLADPYLVLANVTAFYDWDWEGAIGHYESALERNPNHAPAYLDYAAYQIVTGNIGHARELMAMAEKVGRQSAATQGQIGVLYHFIREWDLAHRHYDQALAIEPENTFWRVNKACTYIFSGDYELARELIAQLRTDEPQEPFPRIVEAYYRAVTTMEQQAHEAFASIEPGTLDSMSRLMRASILIALDRHEEALDNLEDAVDSRLLALPYSAIHPTHDPLRTNPRYQAVLKQIGLTSVAHNLVVAADIDFGNERRRMPALQSGASRTP